VRPASQQILPDADKARAPPAKSRCCPCFKVVLV
jgi:hypothetical protein